LGRVAQRGDGAAQLAGFGGRGRGGGGLFLGGGLVIGLGPGRGGTGQRTAARRARGQHRRRHPDRRGGRGGGCGPRIRRRRGQPDLVAGGKREDGQDESKAGAHQKAFRKR